MVQFNSKHWKTQILSKGSTLDWLEASNKICQRHPTNLLVKQPKTTAPRTELSNASEEVIKKVLLSLDSNKATGMDQIPGTFLRNGAEVLTLPFRNIINLLIKSSTFPEECKIAKLKPMFKKGARTDLKNYRPISLFPLSSKNNWKIDSLSNWRPP